MNAATLVPAVHLNAMMVATHRVLHVIMARPAPAADMIRRRLIPAGLNLTIRMATYAAMAVR